MSNEGELKAVFDSFDVDGSGTIQLCELKEIAIKLGSQLSEEEVQRIIKKLDTNDDGKISYEEFKYWWETGHKGKLGELVFMKAKALKLTNQFVEKCKAIGLSMDNYMHSPETDKHYVEVVYGERKEDGMGLNFKVFQQGSKYDEEINQIKAQKIPWLNQSSVNLIIAFPSNNAEEAKEKILDFIKGALQFVPIPIEDLEDNPFLCLKIRVSGNKVYIHVEIKAQLNEVATGPLSAFDSVLAILGQDFFGSIEGEFHFNTNIHSLLQKDNLIQNLLKGFSFKLQVEIVSAFMKKIRQLSEGMEETSKKLSIFSLLKKINLKIKLKSPEQVEKFYEKLGIKELLFQCPNLSDILQMLSGEQTLQMMKSSENSHPMQLIYRLLQFANEFVEAGVEFMLVRNKSVIKLQTNFKDAMQIYKILFNVV